MKIYIPFLLIALTACGPSPEEKQNIAIITCNIMGESINMNASMRIKEINSARTRINADPYLSGDAAIKEAFRYGLCEELVLDDPEYKNKLSTLIEAQRIATKIAEEAAAEKEKIAAEKAKKEKIANTRAYTSEVIKVFKEYPPNPILDTFKMDLDSFGNEYIEVIFSCENLTGLSGFLIIDFKNDIGQLKEMFFCTGNYGFKQITNYGFESDADVGWTRDIEDVFYKDNPKDYVNLIYIKLLGKVNLDEYKRHFTKIRDQRDLLKRIDPKTYGLESYDNFDVSKVKSKFVLYESQN